MKRNVPEQEVDAILDSLDGMQKAEPRPFFYTRLKARMEKEAAPQGLAGIKWLKPSLAFASLTLFVALNVVTIISHKGNTPTKRTADTDLVQQMAQDYDQSITAY